MKSFVPYTPPRSLPPKLQRSTFALVDLGAVSHNVGLIRQRVGPERGLMAMVKADGYGHGAVAVARTALTSGADWLGVAFPEEGLTLREAGIRVPILVLGPTSPSQAPVVVEADLTLAVFSLEVARALNQEAVRRDRRVHVHVKVDTGMGRVGVPAGEAVDFLQALRDFDSLVLQGIYTHFATADHVDKSFTLQQSSTLLQVCRDVQSRGISIPLKHLSNSAAVLDLPETFQDLVRPGIMIYGCYPSDAVSREIELWPAMTWKTEVAFVKETLPGQSVSYGRTFVAEEPMRIATLPVGYADGFSRLLSNRGHVLIHGMKAPVVGVVCMDMTMVNVTHIPGVKSGDEAVIFGKQAGESLPVEELAQMTNTISYEVFCRVGSRVPRVYLHAPQESRRSGHDPR